MEILSALSYEWYLMLSRLSSALSSPIEGLLGAQDIPGLSALLLGLLGGLAPCQVSANAGAIAYVSQSDPRRRPLWASVGAFVLGKAMVYALLGSLAVMLGWRLPASAMVFLRRLSGPLLVAMALFLLGWIRWQGTLGAGIAERLQARLPRWLSPAFGLGAAFALSFCPTMAMIFFGWLVPLLLQARAGLLLAVIFAAGTAVPVLLWAGALSLGRSTVRAGLRGLRRADRYVRRIAGAVLLMLGLNDVLLYWFM
ncbi:urease accessory protein UreH domain-containing protein [Symbiobacterium terraclitae]|uniref:urease accessory protein UreH domain-containing protein n=1 Tax=Symbiobacterium terraclitae TaxID=557451 RepID=UPI0035B568BE